MEPIPEEVAAFLSRNIESIDQLEILRLLGEDPAQAWTAAALARAVQIEAPVAERHVAALHTRRLLTTEARGAEVVYRHGPPVAETARLVGRLLQVYKERPVSMIRLVYARPADPVKAFADAFRLRKEGG